LVTARKADADPRAPENATRVREISGICQGDISKLLEVLDANVAWR
jgi:hypothetical protein